MARDDEINSSIADARVDGRLYKQYRRGTTALDVKDLGNPKTDKNPIVDLDVQVRAAEVNVTQKALEELSKSVGVAEGKNNDNSDAALSPMPSIEHRLRTGANTTKLLTDAETDADLGTPAGVALQEHHFGPGGNSHAVNGVNVRKLRKWGPDVANPANLDGQWEPLHIAGAATLPLVDQTNRNNVLYDIPARIVRHRDGVGGRSFDTQIYDEHSASWQSLKPWATAWGQVFYFQHKGDWQSHQWWSQSWWAPLVKDRRYRIHAHYTHDTNTWASVTVGFDMTGLDGRPIPIRAANKSAYGKCGSWAHAAAGFVYDSTATGNKALQLYLYAHDTTQWQDLLVYVEDVGPV